MLIFKFSVRKGKWTYVVVNIRIAQDIRQILMKCGDL